MFDLYIRQLDNPETTIRRQAILLLANLADPRALPFLDDIHRKDGDPAVRDLALKARQHIEARIQGSGSSALSSPELPAPFMPIADGRSAPHPATRAVSQRDKKEARRQLDSAIDSFTRGDSQKALDALTEAVRLNRNLAKESVALNLASALTAMTTPPQAMQMILERAEFPPAGKGNLIIPGTFRPREAPLRFDKEFINLFLMLLALFAVSTVFYFTVKLDTSNPTDVVNKLTPSSLVGEIDSRQTVSLLESISSGQALNGGLQIAASGLLDTGLLYAVGTLLGGSGVLLTFMARLLRVQVVWYLALTVLLALASLGPVSTAGDTASGVPGAIRILISLTVLGGLYWQVRAVTLNHHVNIVKGLMIINAASLLTIAAAWLLRLFS